MFGDTEPSDAPNKPWLDHKPDPGKQSVVRLQSDRLQRGTVLFAKFAEFEDRSTSIDMLGAFFIASGILNERIAKVLRHEDTRILNHGVNWYFAKNADVELVIDLQLMPGFTVDEAKDLLTETLAGLLDEPISKYEIHQLRQKEVVWSQNMARRPSAFLWFLQNVAADGFPPISPSVFAETLSNTTDQEVIDFAEKSCSPRRRLLFLQRKLTDMSVFKGGLFTVLFVALTLLPGEGAQAN